MREVIGEDTPPYHKWAFKVFNIYAKALIKYTKSCMDNILGRYL